MRKTKVFIAATLLLGLGCSARGSVGGPTVDGDAASTLDAPVTADAPITLDGDDIGGGADVPSPLDQGVAADGGRDAPSPDAPSPDAPSPDAPTTPGCARRGAVDLLLMVDNSNSMAENQANLARNLALFFDSFGEAHVGVVSSDLGTPGSVVPSCANSDRGDDGLLNPIRNGLAIRTHQPWTTAPPGRRPARCTNDPAQYPSFLTYGSAATSPADFRDDVVCNAYLSTGGCGLEQQLESVYRALVVHDARARPGNSDPNAGFVRDDAVLAILMLTDEEDGSTRDCRFAEAGVPCTDALGVFDIMSPDWASNDLNLRFYNYVPGSRQDPTWPLERYIDPARPSRGFTSLKPGRPDLVVFGAIAGVPLDLPMRADAVDWVTLLGSRPDGSDGFTGTQGSSGPVSMRQRNMDPMCGTRVVPACRREGSPAVTTCDLGAQYFAWPSRRVAQVARRFDETTRSGMLSSICANDYTPAFRRFSALIAQRYCP